MRGKGRQAVVGMLAVGVLAALTSGFISAARTTDSGLTSVPAPAQPPRGDRWRTVWRDAFTGAAGSPVSSARWRYATGTHSPGGPPGWGNGELESYATSTENVHLDGRGDVAIVPIKNDRDQWTSGRLETRTDFHPTAGGSLAFSARIRLPAGGQGYWPAFWMLGTPIRPDDHWPAVGELDAMENIDNEPTVRGSMHCGQVSLGGPCNEPMGLTATHTLGRPAGSAGFHTYTVVLNTRPERATWYLDDERYITVTATALGSGTWRSTFAHRFLVLLNVAIGGRVPGAPDAGTQSGAAMLVDQVTVARSRDAGAGPPTF